jgi:hypothetical protein
LVIVALLQVAAQSAKPYYAATVHGYRIRLEAISQYRAMSEIRTGRRLFQTHVISQNPERLALAKTFGALAVFSAGRRMITGARQQNAELRQAK